ncbi:hypothetical protein [Pricia sp.]|uniref:hypothetical protein n=1 Tax=Pricia sp. TaxID=2268138 RepID=UPI00359350DD
MFFTFAMILKAQTYISVLLFSIFLVKFLAIDANGLNILFSGSDITFVNPNCKKKNSPKLLENTANFSQAELVSSQMVHLNGLCNSQFQIELFSWDTDISEPPITYSEHSPSMLSYLYLDTIFPPPRLF